jgi:hypothetical protein
MMEATREVARKAVHNSEPAHARGPSETPPETHPLLTLQKQAGNQAVQRLLCSRGIQAKLAVSQPGDPDEREADQVADRIMRSPGGAPISSPCACSEGEEMCAECQQKQGAAVARKAESSGHIDSDPSIVHEVLRSPGQPLDSATRAFFEPRFGHDFSDVRMHADEKAAESAKAVSALAYAVGPKIVMGAAYSPSTSEGRHLLAHELAHVVQHQTSGPPASLHRQSNPDACCCCAESIDLSDFWLEEDWGEHLAGHFFRPVIKLVYKGTGAHKSCRLEWWEKTNVPYSLVPTPGVWTQITDPKAGSIEMWNKQVKEPCPGSETIKLLDPPSVAKTSGGTGRTVTRILEFRIIVDSGAGCSVCGKSLVKATAKQTLVIVNGNVDKTKSKFEVPNPDDRAAGP